MPAITFEALVKNNIVEIPMQYYGKTGPFVFITIPENRHQKTFNNRRIIPKRGLPLLTDEDFGKPFINTKGWKFDREKANER
jgi:hypothetical protein